MTFRPSAALILGFSLLLAVREAPAQLVIPDDSASKKGSEFLRPPGSSNDAYGPKTDWSTIPAWRQTAFFGVRAKGKTFIYVVDCSGSMADGGRLARAKAEIRKSVGMMQFPQKFHVIFYNDRPLAMPGGVPQSGGYDASKTLSDWLRLIEPEGETDPRAAVAQAIALKPDAVFLLSDGEFPKGTIESIARGNRSKVPIHCVDLAGGSGGEQLKRIARESGGEYALRLR